MQSLADYIFARQAKYIYFSVILISAILGIETYKWYLERELLLINNSIDSVELVSDKIAREIERYTYTVNLAISDYESSMINSPYALRKIFKSIGVNSEYIYGVGYFWDPKIYNYGEYIYESSNTQIIIESMNQIYGDHHTVYYKRPWFTDVVQTKTHKIYSPQISWTGESYSLLTYAFPIRFHQNIIAVGVYDISMTYFKQGLNELLGMISVQNNKSLNIYYNSLPYSSSHNHSSFYDINNSERPITDLSTILSLCYIIHDGKSQFHNWQYHQGNIYRKVSLLDNSLILLLEYNLKKILWFTCLWIITTIICLKIILNWLKKIITRQLSVIVKPIAEISHHSSMLAKNRLNFSFQAYMGGKISEVSQLSASLEKMRKSLQQLILKERELEKSTAELKLAAKLQEKMIPFTFEQHVTHGMTELSIAARFIPAHILSGDLYDIVIIADNIYVLIGDATGKNLTAAFFSLFVLGRFRMLCQNQSSPSEIMTDLNNYLCNTNAENMFISAVCLQINLGSDEITLSNAGHEMPIVINKQNDLLIIENNDPDLVLGILANNLYHLYKLPQLSNLRNITLITDGISEATAPNGQLLGIERVQNLVNRDSAMTAHDMCATILNLCHEFENSPALSDDRSVISINFDATAKYRDS